MRGTLAVSLATPGNDARSLVRKPGSCRKRAAISSSFAHQSDNGSHRSPLPLLVRDQSRSNAGDNRSHRSPLPLLVRDQRRSSADDNRSYRSRLPQLALVDSPTMACRARSIGAAVLNASRVRANVTVSLTDCCAEHDRALGSPRPASWVDLTDHSGWLDRSIGLPGANPSVTLTISRGAEH